MAHELTAADFAGLDVDSPVTVERDGYTFTARIERDDDMGAPWKEHDGHGPVSDWRPMGSHGHAPKRPGEFVLCSERGGCSRFYDFAEACKIARRDGWGSPNDEGMSPRQKAAKAAAADFRRLAEWCADEWFWVGVVVEVSHDGRKRGGASIWGVESDAGDYFADLAADLAAEALAEAGAALGAPPFTVRIGSARGAPFGRIGGRLRYDAGPVTLAEVPLADGYDPGGAYWGERAPGFRLWCAWQGPEAVYFDADSRDAATAWLRAYAPALDFVQ